MSHTLRYKILLDFSFTFRDFLAATGVSSPSKTKFVLRPDMLNLVVQTCLITYHVFQLLSLS